jgi:cell division septation protein DedD
MKLPRADKTFITHPKRQVCLQPISLFISIAPQRTCSTRDKHRLILWPQALNIPSPRSNSLFLLTMAKLAVASLLALVLLTAVGAAQAAGHRRAAAAGLAATLPARQLQQNEDYGGYYIDCDSPDFADSDYCSDTVDSSESDETTGEIIDCDLPENAELDECNYGDGENCDEPDADPDYCGFPSGPDPTSTTPSSPPPSPSPSPATKSPTTPSPTTTTKSPAPSSTSPKPTPSSNSPKPTPSSNSPKPSESGDSEGELDGSPASTKPAGISDIVATLTGGSGGLATGAIISAAVGIGAGAFLL